MTRNYDMTPKYGALYAGNPSIMQSECYFAREFTLMLVEHLSADVNLWGSQNLYISLAYEIKADIYTGPDYSFNIYGTTFYYVKLLI
jgi:hypothetical protein